MSLERLQEVVEALGARLRRGVAVDDHTLQLVAVGPDFGDADPARIWSLLNRRTRPEDVDYASLRSLTAPRWVPADPEVQLFTRLCIPVRNQGALLGFMWLIDRDRTLREDDIADAVATADEIGVLLRQRLVIRDRESALADHLLQQLLGEAADERTNAAAELLSHSLVRDDSHVGVLALRPVAAPSLADDSAGLNSTVHEVCRRLPPGTCLISASERAATVLVAQRHPVDATLTSLGEDLLDAVARDGRGTWRVGAGAASQGLGAAAHAYEQALVALRVATRLPELGRLVRWDDLGPYALIGQMPISVLSDDLLPIGLLKLLRSAAQEQLLVTVETFLDSAGDKQRTASALGIHRTTLYYRLERIEEMTGLSMASGQDRLLAHLAVKLHRMLAPLQAAAPAPGRAPADRAARTTPAVRRV